MNHRPKNIDFMVAENLYDRLMALADSIETHPWRLNHKDTFKLAAIELQLQVLINDFYQASHVVDEPQTEKK